MSTTADDVRDGIERTVRSGGEGARIRSEAEQSEDQARAESFERDDRETGTRRYPELATAYELAELAAQFASENLREAERAAFEGHTREFIATRLRGGELVLASRLEELAERSRNDAEDRELRRGRERTVELGINRESDQDR
jgi:hypothetical protein